MANVLTGNPLIVDTVGILWDKPICIKKIVMYPNAASDTAIFYYWQPGTSNALATISGATTTVASGVITSTGNFEATEAEAYGVITISHDSLTSARVASSNIGLSRMIASVDSDNQITTTPTDLTDEASGIYSWQTFSPIVGPKVVAMGTEVATETLDFPDGGLQLPNLILGSITAGGAVLHIYI
jgi:hypothetical protein